MNFSLTEDQTLLVDALKRFLDKNYTPEMRQRMVLDQEPMSREVWTGFASLGILGLTLSEEHGGFSGSGIDVMVVMRELGKYLVIEPYIPNVVIAAGLVELCGSDWHKKVLLPELIKGESTLVLAHTEMQGHQDLSHVETIARQEGGVWVLSGKKTLILGGASADRFIISARTSGSSGDKDGITLFIAESLDESISGQVYPLLDGSRVLDIQFDNLRLGSESVIGTLDRAFAPIECVYDRAAMASCAEALGAMETAYEMTVDYLKDRHQFGQSLSQFQVLQHRAVDMFINIEEAHSLLTLAAANAWGDSPYERARSVSAAKSLFARAARFVSQQAVQLHGGMGMTYELPLSNYVKKLTMFDALFGGERFHRSRFSNLRKEEADTTGFVSPKKSWKQL